ncbi:MAG: DUF4340 domain-containing protein [Clostridia bacterium]|nr:DUF4340 domain-containing protein [Clostridia bacterium]
MKIFKSIKELFTKGEKTTLQRQARMGIIALAVVLVGLTVYFAIIMPAFRKAADYVPQLYDGEQLYGSNTILMEKFRTRADVVKIEVNTADEHFTLAATDPGASTTSFEIVGSLDTVLDEKSVSTFVVNSLMLVTNSPKFGTQDRVNEYATDEDLTHYGLDAASSPASVKVTLTDGTSYTLYVGDVHPAADGYYAMIEGRRNVVTDEATGETKEYYIVYSLTTYTATSLVVQKSTALVSTYVMPFFSSGIYQPKDFMFERLYGDEYKRIVQLHAVDADTQTSSGESFILDYPKGYIVNESTLTSFILPTLEYLQAESIVAYGETVHDPEVYEKYGLDLDPARLENGSEKCFARLGVDVDDISGKDYFENGRYFIYFGDAYYDETLGAEYRYAYAPYSETIFTVKTETFEYVTWHSVRYISARMYFDNITSLDYISLIGPGTDVRYDITGNYMTYHVDVTLASDTSVPVIRDGEPLTFDVQPKVVKMGTYTQTQFEGEFENFRKLYYVLITREYAIEADNVVDTVADSPYRTVVVQKTERDTNETYYRYDANGEKITDSDGKYVTAIYDGGFIRCHNVDITVKGLDGNETTLHYDTAYYNEETGRFFLKEEDRADGNFKPKNYTIGSDGHLTKWTYLSGKATGEYTRTVYTFNCYDILYDYTDANGVTTKRVNQTYSYVVPTTTVYKYRINEDGTHELIGEETSVADGVCMRIAQLDKLFNDSQKLFDKIEIDKFGAN